jgi:hypothetical protein
MLVSLYNEYVHLILAFVRGGWAKKDGIMRQFKLASLVALCLTIWSASAALGANMMILLQATSGQQEEQPKLKLPVMKEGNWLWDLMPHHFIVPLAPDNQNISPLGTKGEQWIGVVVTQLSFG